MSLPYIYVLFDIVSSVPGGYAVLFKTYRPVRPGVAFILPGK